MPLMSRVEQTADRAPKSRLGMSDGLKQNAEGAVKTAIEILSVAAAMTQNVPYLGIISGVLGELLKIYNEVEVLKSDWKTTAHITEQIKSVIDDVCTQCQPNNLELPKVMMEPLEELERSVLVTLETLTRCRAGSKRWRDRARTILSRGDLVDDVKQCQTRMQAALNLFNTKLQIDQTINIHTIVAHLRETKVQSSTAPELTTAIIGFTSLPPMPAIFHGRVQEVDHIVDLLVNKPPARVAILGSGGIGKTSIALTALHNPEVETMYGDRRFFLSCEAVSNADGMTQELLRTFGVVVSQGRSTQDALLSRMRTLSDGLLCLDNLETPWDDDKLAVESLLARIAALPRFALLVTTRGADRPLQVAWTQPFLQQIKPLTLAAALRTWDAICGLHDDYAKRLIEAVDRVPLAVTLLAHLAESESPETLWARWERELTDLIRVRGPDHRLGSVDISVRLSLHGPRVRDDEATMQCFSVLCTLPQGMQQSRIPAFVKAYAELLPNMHRSIALLKRCSLAFSTEDGFLRVLSPVRHYMQTHHPISSPLFTCLAAIYRALIQGVHGDWAVRAVYAKYHVRPELANITAILMLCLTHDIRGHRPAPASPFTVLISGFRKITRQLNHGLPSFYLQQTAEGIIRFSDFCIILTFYDTGLLSEAIAHCNKHGMLAAEAKLWFLKGRCLYYQNHHRNSLVAFEQALDLYRSATDRAGEAESLKYLGDTHTVLSHNTEAESALLSAQSLYEVIGGRLGKANSLNSLGDLYRELGRLDEAERALSSAQSLYDDIGDRLGKANCLKSLGNLYMQLGRLNHAEKTLLFAQSLYDEIGDHLGKTVNLLYRGEIYLRLNRLDESETVLHLAQDLNLELENQLITARTHILMGALHRLSLRHDKALTVLKNASQLSRDISFLSGQGEAHHQIGLVHADRNGLDEAEKHIKTGLRLLEQAQHPYYVRLARQSLQDVLARRQVSEDSGLDKNLEV